MGGGLREERSGVLERRGGLEEGGKPVWDLKMAALVPLPWRQRKRILGEWEPARSKVGR